MKLKREPRSYYKLIVFVLAFFAINSYGLNILGDTTYREVPEDVLELNALILPGFYPEFDFYYNWDTLALDPYRFNVKTLNREIPVTLLHADCGYTLPISGKVNSGFGWRGGVPHQGIDLQLRTGDSVRVAFDGVVRMSRWYSGYGNCIIVRHYNGFETLYGHLSYRIAKPGDLVNAGQLIGLGGSTGRSTGPHLHFETRFLGRPINPASIIDFKGDSLIYETLLISQESFHLPNSFSRFKFKKGKRHRGFKLKYKNRKRRIMRKRSHVPHKPHSKIKHGKSKLRTPKRRHAFAYPLIRRCTIDFTV
jgi:hypothetical protein